MSARRGTSATLGAALVLLPLVVACGSEDMPRTKASPDPGDPEAVGSSSAAADEGDLDATAKVSQGSAFALFCGAASELSLGGDEKLLELRAAFCTDAGEPTRFFAKTLPAKRWTDTGDGSDPALLRLAEPEHDDAARTTAVTVAGAVLLSGTAKEYFDAATGFVGDPASARAKGVAMIDGTVEEEVLSGGFADGMGAWEKRVAVETEAAGQTVRSEYEYHVEHHVLVEGKAYLLASHLTKSLKGVKGSSVFTALVQGKEISVLMTGVWTKTQNRGMPDVAKDTLVKIIKQGLKNTDGISKMVAADPD
jgi:hypothetical protein